MLIGMGRNTTVSSAFDMIKSYEDSNLRADTYNLNHLGHVGLSYYLWIGHIPYIDGYTNIKDPIVNIIKE